MTFGPLRRSGKSPSLHLPLLESICDLLHLFSGAKMVPNHPLDHVDFERKVAVFQNDKTKQLEEVPPSLSPLLFFFYCRFDALPLFAYLRFSFPYRSPTRRCGDPMVATARSVVRSSGSPTRPRRPSSSAPATWSLRFSLTRTVPSSISFYFLSFFSFVFFICFCFSL